MALKSGNSKIVTLLPLSFHLTKYQNSMETQFRHFFFLKKKRNLNKLNTIPQENNNHVKIQKPVSKILFSYLTLPKGHPKTNSHRYQLN